MKLQLLDSRELLCLAAGWMVQKKNYQRPDFDDGKQALAGWI